MQVRDGHDVNSPMVSASVVSGHANSWSALEYRNIDYVLRGNNWRDHELAVE